MAVKKKRLTFAVFTEVKVNLEKMKMKMKVKKNDDKGKISTKAFVNKKKVDYNEKIFF